MTSSLRGLKISFLTTLGTKNVKQGEGGSGNGQFLMKSFMDGLFCYFQSAKNFEIKFEYLSNWEHPRQNNKDKNMYRNSLKF